MLIILKYAKFFPLFCIFIAPYKRDDGYKSKRKKAEGKKTIG